MLRLLHVRVDQPGWRDLIEEKWSIIVCSDVCTYTVHMVKKSLKNSQKDNFRLH